MPGNACTDTTDCCLRASLLSLLPVLVPVMTGGSGSGGLPHLDSHARGSLQGFAEVLLRRVPFSLLEEQVRVAPGVEGRGCPIKHVYLYLSLVCACLRVKFIYLTGSVVFYNMSDTAWTQMKVWRRLFDLLELGHKIQLYGCKCSQPNVIFRGDNLWAGCHSLLCML